MRKILLIAVLALVPVMVSAQVFIEEDFSGTFPPSGWAADSHGSNWHEGASNNAGGASPEAVFDWSPQFSGITRFMSPRIDLTGITNLKVEFKHMIDHYSGAYTVGIATRHGTGAWNMVWQRANPGGDVGPETINREIANDDVGASDFQICWFFNGASYNIDYWYIDDVLLYSPLDHDVKVKEILVDDQYEPGYVISPDVIVENFGLNEETFDVNCEILLGESIMYSETLTGITLGAGQTQTVEFPNFTIAAENELYEIVVTTQLSGDENPGNDSKNKFFNTYTTPRDMVLLEIGTGTWCQYCPGAAMGAEDMADNGHNVAVVEYHASGGDPFENVYSLARVNYYGISGFPTAVFDGVLKFVGGSNNQSMYSNYLPLFQQRQPINSAFTIEIHGDNEGNSYSLTITVNKMARIAYENMVLHVALTESNIQYNWQGQTHLEWVERLMTPDANGTSLDFTGGDTQNINLNFTFNPVWNSQYCELTAFIQNLDDKEILQGTKVMLPELTPVGINDDVVELPSQTKLAGNYPNPFNPATSIHFSLKQTGNVSLEIFNVLGQKVRTLIDDRMVAGNHSIVWDSKDDTGSEVASGAYFYRLTTDNYSDTKKMVLMK